MPLLSLRNCSMSSKFCFFVSFSLSSSWFKTSFSVSSSLIFFFSGAVCSFSASFCLAYSLGFMRFAPLNLLSCPLCICKISAVSVWISRITCFVKSRILKFCLPVSLSSVMNSKCACKFGTISPCSFSCPSSLCIAI